MHKNLEGNIWKYTILLIANKRIFVAILGAYYLTIPGVTAQTIGTILLVSSLSGFLFEIPSGYVSDKIGHKHAIVISRILMALSTLFFLFAQSTVFLILGGIFLSAAGAFLSGTGTAFMHETLRALKKEEQYSQIMGKMSSIGFAVPIVLMVLVPFLVSVSYQTPFLIALVIDVIGLLAALSLHVPPVAPEHVEEVNVTNFKQVMQEGYRLKYFRIAIFSGIIGGVLFSIGGFRAPYQAFLEIPIIWFGVFFGIGRVLASLLLAQSGRIARLLPPPRFYRFKFILFSCLLLLLGTVSTAWVVVVVLILINGFQWGLSKVGESYQLEKIKSSKFKATLLSTGAQIQEVIAAASSFGLGFLIERFSYHSAFFLLSIVFFIILLPLYLSIARKYKTNGSPHLKPV